MCGVVSIQCPNCGKNVMDLANDGMPRLRAKVVLFTEHGAVALCVNCSCHVPVPLSFTPSVEDKPTKKVIHYVPNNR